MTERLAMNEVIRNRRKRRDAHYEEDSHPLIHLKRHASDGTKQTLGRLGMTQR